MLSPFSENGRWVYPFTSFGASTIYVFAAHVYYWMQNIRKGHMPYTNSVDPDQPTNPYRLCSLIYSTHRYLGSVECI